jgi:hypothetical protein
MNSPGVNYKRTKMSNSGYDELDDSTPMMVSGGVSTSGYDDVLEPINKLSSGLSVISKF